MQLRNGSVAVGQVRRGQNEGWRAVSWRGIGNHWLRRGSEGEGVGKGRRREVPLSKNIINNLAEKEALNVLLKLIKYHFLSLILRGPREPNITRIPEGKKPRAVLQSQSCLPACVLPSQQGLCPFFTFQFSLCLNRVSKNQETPHTSRFPRRNCASHNF